MIPSILFPCPVWVAFGFIILITVLWGRFCIEWRKKPEQFWKVNDILKWILIVVILCGTICSRFWLDLPETWIDVTPFGNSALGTMTIGAWSNIITNILLFEPLGMVMVNLLSMERSRGDAFWLTVLKGFVFSFFVEVVQFVFNWGAFELEDIICNVAGMAIGALSIFISMSKYENVSDD